MPAPSRLSYLKKRGNRWWLKIAIPRDIQHLYPTTDKQGLPTANHRTHIEEPLRTQDLDEANRHKHARIDYWLAEFVRVRRQGTASAIPGYARKAEELREMLRDAVDDDDAEILSMHVTDLAEEIAQKTKSETTAKRFAKLAFRGEKPTLRQAFDSFIAEGEHTEGTKAKYRQVFDEFYTRLNDPSVLPEEVTHEVAEEYNAWLHKEAQSAHGGPLAYRTRKERKRTLFHFWRDLERRRIVPHGSNPWLDLKVAGRRKPQDANEGAKRIHKDAEILKLLDGSEVSERKGVRYTKRILLEMYALGFYTGCRLNELCSLMVGDVEPMRGGYILHIRRAKTDAGIRSLPIRHSIPVAILRRIVGKRTNLHEQLFPELIPGGQDAKLSWHMQKALGRYRDRVGFGADLDFHSTRRNFYTRLVELDVADTPRALYLGHAAKGMAQVYTKKTHMILTKVAQTIRYPAKVEAAFRKALDV